MQVKHVPKVKHSAKTYSPLASLLLDPLKVEK